MCVGASLLKRYILYACRYDHDLQKHYHWTVMYNVDSKYSFMAVGTGGGAGGQLPPPPIFCQPKKIQDCKNNDI